LKNLKKGHLEDLGVNGKVILIDLKNGAVGRGLDDLAWDRKKWRIVVNTALKIGAP